MVVPATGVSAVINSVSKNTFAVGFSISYVTAFIVSEPEFPTPSIPLKTMLYLLLSAKVPSSKV